MAEDFLSLSPADRKEALEVAASASGRPAHLLEKDVWVVWTLATLFQSPFGRHLVFKGGTSLSKAYQAIGRFSEDIDVTHDIRALIPELVKAAGEQALPPSGSQEKKWTKAIRKELPRWIAETALPALQAALENAKLTARVHAENENLYLEYATVASGYSYVKPRVQVEFGARSTGEPANELKITCDAASHLPSLSFPTATPRVMVAERTFWEKATAIHVFCHQGTIKERLARHWYDIARLDEVGFADKALADRKLGQHVADHKGWFFEEKDSSGKVIDYSAAVNGGLQLVPEGAVLEALATDYAKMIEEGLLLEDAEPFENIIRRCRSLQDRANSVG